MTTHNTLMPRRGKARVVRGRGAQTTHPFPILPFSSTHKMTQAATGSGPAAVVAAAVVVVAASTRGCANEEEGWVFLVFCLFPFVPAGALRPWHHEAGRREW